MSELKRLPHSARMSSAVMHGNTVFFKGVTSRGGPPDISGQTRDVLSQIDALLDQAGTSKDRLIQVMVWLSDMAHFEAMNEIYDQWVVPDRQPVRACVQARLASDELLLEIQVMAAL
jgi:enamine deaminase RidA (YjgF/YER057c/UK114 family)